MSTRSLVFATTLAVLSGSTLADSPNLGRVAAPEEIASWDIGIGPDGAGLPPGSGTPKQGEAVYSAKCLACHGEKGTGKPNDPLVGGRGTLIRFRSRPSEVSGPTRRRFSTTCDDEVYAVVAYILQLNGIIGDNEVIDAQTLPKIRMPNRDGFVTFSRGK